MKKYLIAMAALAAVASASARSFAVGVGEKLHDSLFSHMARSGMVLGMAELATVTRTAVAIAAGQKTHPAAHNRVRSVIIDTPATYTAANGDTFGTGIVLLKGSRLLAPITLSNNTNAASVTLSLGLRNNATKVAVDATALCAATAITTATCAQLNTGTKLTAGQYYVLDADMEIYGAFGGATPTANVAIRAEIQYVAP
jgi:hypothetical protein